VREEREGGDNEVKRKEAEGLERTEKCGNVTEVKEPKGKKGMGVGDRVEEVNPRNSPRVVNTLANDSCISQLVPVADPGVGGGPKWAGPSSRRQKFGKLSTFLEENPVLLIFSNYQPAGIFPGAKWTGQGGGLNLCLHFIVF
jgi:hypothetical protein